MPEPTEVQVVPLPQRLEALTLFLGSTSMLMTPTLHLFANNFTPTPANVVADFTEATFTGYTAVAGLTWSLPYYDVDGTALTLGEDEVFIATGTAVTNVIYGYYLTNAAGSTLLASYKFASPVGIAAIGQAVSVVPFFRYSGI